MRKPRSRAGFAPGEPAFIRDPALPIDIVAALPTELLTTAAATQEPLPALIGGMTLWGLGITAVALIPMSLAALIASPIAIASNMLHRSS